MARSTRGPIVREELAFCVLWAPLAPITWFCPVIGHLGIADSQGIASDFQGSYYVNYGREMMTGAPTRALCMPVSQMPGGAAAWDDKIKEANELYAGRTHNICCDNCHSHVAYALNAMEMKAFGITKWDMVKLACLVFVKGRFLSVPGILAQFLPSMFVLSFIIFFAAFGK